ncbi:MAG: glycosyltransferase family 1 protein [Kiritimatiellae bacterium]|nr:glycosyltransferase family 1 protein [Kiritimatiellia bacterium]MDD5522701.1 glycosyltransferase family 1 protein [Kiritimatiellia bacterium]
MKIGINTLFLIPGEVGGTETYLRQTLLAMAEYFSDVPLVLFTNRENDSVLKEDLGQFSQVTFVMLDFGATKNYTRILREQVELPGKVRSAGVDVLWSLGYTAPFFSPCPQVVTIHDMQYKTYPQDPSLRARILIDLLVKIATKRCDRVIAVSHFSKDEIVKYTGVSPDKVDVVYEAANPAFGEVVPLEKRKQLLSVLIPVDKPYILSVSNTYSHKNIHALVKAFGEIMGKIPHNLVLVGRPRQGEGEVQKALSSISDKSRIFRLQKLSMERLVSLYQGCDIFVFPSLYEGFGLPVLEAMMAGVPVLTTKKGSIPEVGGDGVRYFNPGDGNDLSAKILETLNLPQQEKSALIVRAKEIAKGYYWKWTALRSLDVLYKALE